MMVATTSRTKAASATGRPRRPARQSPTASSKRRSRGSATALSTCIDQRGTPPPAATARANSSKHSNLCPTPKAKLSASVSLVRANKYPSPAASRIGPGNKRRLK